MADSMLPEEREISEEVIRMYKAHPVLWDRRHRHYMKREIREKAYNVILKKFKTLYKTATVKEVRKKIENMRSGHRKEWKKIAESEARGDVPPYTPKVWYFKALNFIKYDDIPYESINSFNLNTSDYDEYEEMEDSSHKPASSYSHSGSDHQLDISEEYIDENEDSLHKPESSISHSGSEHQLEMAEEFIDENEDSSHKPASNSSHSGSDHQIEMAEEFIDENEDFDHFYDDHDYDVQRPKKRKLSSGLMTINKKQNRVTKTNDQASSTAQEAMAFGMTVGLQLHSLDGFQRTVAERLISEVIFYARLNRLSTHSYFNLDDD